VQQVKIFRGADTEVEDIEKQINRFIRKNGIRVLSITGNFASNPPTGSSAMSSFAGGDIMIILLFETDSTSS
jgi:hypothetical protein